MTLDDIAHDEVQHPVKPCATQEPTNRFIKHNGMSHAVMHLKKDFFQNQLM